MSLKNICLGMLFFATAISCQKKPEEQQTAQSTPPEAERYLYVASGQCFSAPGNITFTATTASNIIYAVNLRTGNIQSILSDYTIPGEPLGSTPVSIIDYDDNYLLALVQNSLNAGGRKIEKIPKTIRGEKTLYYSDANGMGATAQQLRHLIMNPLNKDLYFSKTTAVEKINSLKVRQHPYATASWITGLTAGNCAISSSITSVQLLSNGKIVYTNAAAGQNRLGMVSDKGYSTAADCIASAPVTSPQALAFPSASLYLPEFKQLLVLYAGSGNAANLNSIYAYDIDEDTNTLSGATNAYENLSVLYGGTALARNEVTGRIYVATANSVATTAVNYNIEELNYDPTSKKLTRVGTAPFSVGWIGSKCISSMFVGK